MHLYQKCIQWDASRMMCTYIRSVFNGTLLYTEGTHRACPARWRTGPLRSGAETNHRSGIRRFGLQIHLSGAFFQTFAKNAFERVPRTTRTEPHFPDRSEESVRYYHPSHHLDHHLDGMAKSPSRFYNCSESHAQMAHLSGWSWLFAHDPVDRR